MNCITMQNENSQRKKMKIHLICATRLHLENNNTKGALDTIQSLNETPALKDSI